MSAPKNIHLCPYAVFLDRHILRVIVGFFYRLLNRHQIQRNDLCPADQLIAPVRKEDEWNIPDVKISRLNRLLRRGDSQIRWDKWGRVPISCGENYESSSKENDDTRDQREPACVSLIMSVLNFLKTWYVKIGLVIHTGDAIMPRQLCWWYTLFIQRLQQANVVESDGDPRDQGASRSQINEPPEDIHGVVGYTHVSQEGEGNLKQHTHVWHSPLGGTQEYLWSMALDRKTI